MTQFFNRPSISLLALLLAIVIALWLPFGLQNKPVAEEYEVLNLVDQGRGPFERSSVHALRPLSGIPDYIATLIDPVTFAGYHLLVMASFIIRGLLVYWLMRQLAPAYRLLAVGVMLLYIVLPADQVLFYFRGLLVHYSAIGFLLALNVFIMLWRRPRVDRNSVWLALGMMLSLALSFALYDTHYVIAGVVPLTLWWVTRRLSRKLLTLAVLWYAALLPMFLSLVINLFLTPNEGTYQNSILDLSNPLRDVIGSLGYVYQSLIVGVWRLVARELRDFGLAEPQFLILAASAAAVAGLYLLWVARKIPPAQPGERRVILYLLFGALLFIPLAVLPFTITTARYDNTRIFLLSGLGSAVFYGVLLWWASGAVRKLRGIAFSLLVSAALFGSVFSLLLDQQMLARYGSRFFAFAGQIVREIPRLQDKAAVFVLTTREAEQTGNPYEFNWGLTGLLQYAYSDHTFLESALVCLPVDVVEPTNFRTSCLFTPSGIALYFNETLIFEQPYDAVVLLAESAPGTLEVLDALPSVIRLPEAAVGSYAPRALIDSQAAVSSRTRAILNLP